MLNENMDIGTRRILIVEDEPAIREICLYVLSKEGFRVDMADNNKLAEDKIREEEYDLIFVDIRTPVMNGKELYQSIIENFPEMIDRVIFTTGDIMAEGTKAFLRKSDRPFLPKPYTPEELSKIVNETLTRLEDSL